MKPTLALLAALTITSPAIAQDELPRRKSGLWDVSTELPGPRGGAMASQHCVDEKTDGQAMRRALDESGEARCTQSNVRRGAGTFDADYRCEGPRGRTEGSISMRGDLASRYTMVNTMRFDPPRRGTSEARMTVTGTWKGACPADMKPGEVRMTGLPGRAGASAPRSLTPEQQARMKEMMERMRQQREGAVPK